MAHKLKLLTAKRDEAVRENGTLMAEVDTINLAIEDKEKQERRFKEDNYTL